MTLQSLQFRSRLGYLGLCLWWSQDARGCPISGPLPTVEAVAAVLRELALHGSLDGDW